MIIAEGALSESFIDDDSRCCSTTRTNIGRSIRMRQRGPAQYCAPRREHGYEVEAARRRIALRAGLSVLQHAAGRCAATSTWSAASRIGGWAQNIDHPEAPVCLDIYAGGRLIGQTLANRYRKDLARAGLGSGRHSFAFTPPAGLTFAADAVEVRRSLDGASLNLSLSCKTNIASRESRVA